MEHALCVEVYRRIIEHTCECNYALRNYNNNEEYYSRECLLTNSQHNTRIVGNIVIIHILCFCIRNKVIHTLIICYILTTQHLLLILFSRSPIPGSIMQLSAHFMKGLPSAYLAARYSALLLTVYYIHSGFPRREPQTMLQLFSSAQESILTQICLCSTRCSLQLSHVTTFKSFINMDSCNVTLCIKRSHLDILMC